MLLLDSGDGTSDHRRSHKLQSLTTGAPALCPYVEGEAVRIRAAVTELETFGGSGASEFGA